MGKHGADCSGLGHGELAGTCECGNEPLGLEYLTACYILRKDCSLELVS